jgi:RNA polymerase sigma factor (sigma-70 family)
VEETSLIKECLKENSQAQQQLYHQYAAKMLGVCYRYVHSLEEAEDVLQEGFVKVFLHLKKFNGNGPLEAWIRRIMVNTALNQLKKRHTFMEPLDENHFKEKETFFNPEMEAKEIIEEIRQLPLGFRTVLNLYAIEGYSHKEISKMLGISEGTSRSQYARARRAMMKRISGKPFSGGSGQ